MKFIHLATVATLTTSILAGGVTIFAGRDRRRKKLKAKKYEMQSQMQRLALLQLTKTAKEMIRKFLHRKIIQG